MSEAEVMAAVFSDARFDVKAVEIRERARSVDVGADRRGKQENQEKEEKEEKEEEDCCWVGSEVATRSASEELRGLQERDWVGATWVSFAEPMAPAEGALPSAKELRLIAAARRRSPLPTLRIRGLRRQAALVALADFVSLQQAVGRRYVRVITGKGIGSPGEPVLKRVLVVWCAGEGAEFVRELAPEREASLEFGGYILWLRRLGGLAVRDP